ncbi:uncharacterized protein LOC119553348 [Drosophila subpulchrella]|uniref:uncharacterized protein LOC119553348 n=1 Tax=Drosophila subpulchrella TaxID=1486046 RepID=UPI0007E305CD|nr:uncharacterized protein LOC108012667 [Drosophila suzukii]XP_037719615.1 uncharacterized protein LOC119553348 [Drosophila subpulchrella]
MLVKVLMLALLAVLSQAKPQLLVTTPVSYATGAGGTWLATAPSSAYYPAYASYPAYAAYAYAPVYGAYATYPYYPYLRR